MLIIHSDHPCQHLATITPLVAELDEMECFFMGSLISPTLPPVSLQITWDVFIFRNLGFDESTAILFFVIVKWLVGAVQVKLRLNNSVLHFVFFLGFCFCLCFCCCSREWVGAGKEELRLITGFFGFVCLCFFVLCYCAVFVIMCSLFLCVLAFVFVMLRCGWAQQRRS